jgi:hypothetical protein
MTIVMMTTMKIENLRTMLLKPYIKLTKKLYQPIFKKKVTLNLKLVTHNDHYNEHHDENFDDHHNDNNDKNNKTLKQCN